MGDVKKVDATDKSEINLLIIGEKGVGKTTFINSFINYLNYPSIKAAINGGMYYMKYDSDKSKKDSPHLENTTIFGARSYSFVHSKRKYRLIDTAGFGNGLDEDHMHLEDMLLYLQQYHAIHGFCFLFNSNASEITPFFKSVMMHIFTTLNHKTPASANSMFVFTHSRATYYQEGELAKKLRMVLGEVEAMLPNKSKIPYTKDNTFFIDNEVFKFAEASNKPLTVEVVENMGFNASWKSSFSACQALNAYLLRPTLKAYPIRNTLSINDAKYIILELYKPLIDVLELIEDNVSLLVRQQNHILQDISPEELKQTCYIPEMTLKVKSLSQPITVCISNKCSSISLTESGIKKYVYKSCQNPCFFYNIPKELINHKSLKNFNTLFDRNNACSKCNCKLPTHLHLLYDVEYSEEKNYDDNVLLESADDVVRVKFYKLKELQQLCDEYLEEKDLIFKVIAEFQLFLKHNSIMKYSCYDNIIGEYYDSLIQREKEQNDMADKILLARYEKLKGCFEKRMKVISESIDIGPLSTINVFKFLEQLYKMTRSGGKIRELHMKQQKCRVVELKHKEFFEISSVKRQTVVPVAATAAAKSVAPGPPKPAEKAAVKGKVQQPIPQIIQRLVDTNNFQTAVVMLIKELKIADHVDFKGISKEEIKALALKYHSQYKTTPKGSVIVPPAVKPLTKAKKAKANKPAVDIAKPATNAKPAANVEPEANANAKLEANAKAAASAKAATSAKPAANSKPPTAPSTPRTGFSEKSGLFLQENHAVSNGPCFDAPPPYDAPQQMYTPSPNYYNYPPNIPPSNYMQPDMRHHNYQPPVMPPPNLYPPHYNYPPAPNYGYMTDTPTLNRSMSNTSMNSTDSRGWSIHPPPPPGPSASNTQASASGKKKKKNKHKSKESVASQQGEDSNPSTPPVAEKTEVERMQDFLAEQRRLIAETNKEIQLAASVLQK